jgi:hypothetical protein
MNDTDRNDAVIKAASSTLLALGLLVIACAGVLTMVCATTVAFIFQGTQVGIQTGVYTAALALLSFGALRFLVDRLNVFSEAAKSDTPKKFDKEKSGVDVSNYTHKDQVRDARRVGRYGAAFSLLLASLYIASCSSSWQATSSSQE